MMNRIIYLLLLPLIALHLASDLYGQDTAPGAFSRMGFGARGIGFGNAAIAVPWVNHGSYYNPASIAFVVIPKVEATLGVLSLDRRLNYLHFTTRIPPSAGFSISAINAGVSRIDGRNRDGVHTEFLSTSENLFMFAFASQFSPRFSGGLAFKLYYYNLHEGMSSTTLGFDVGLLYRYNESFSFGLSIKDIKSQYKWDSSGLYEQSGRSTTDSFPLMVQAGIAYLSSDKTLLLGIQGEYSKELDLIVRLGAEAYLTEHLTLRGGIDRFHEMNTTKPALGLSIMYPLKNMLPSINYTLVFEPYAPASMHLIGVGVEF